MTSSVFFLLVILSVMVVGFLALTLYFLNRCVMFRDLYLDQYTENLLRGKGGKR